jgi:hypothetical protein
MEKELYRFTVQYSTDVEENESKIENGQLVKITKTVKKTIPVEVVLKKPSRTISEEADIHKAIKMSECVKKGILTKNMLSTKYANAGGILSEEEAKDHMLKYNQLSELQMEWAQSTIAEDGKKFSKKHTQKLTQLLYKMNELRKQIATTESAYAHLFNNTADHFAQKEEIKYLTIMLTYLSKEVDEEKVLEPYFDGKTYEQKLEDFYRKEDENDELHQLVSRKVAYFISFWRNGAVESQEDFRNLDKEISQEK